VRLNVETQDQFPERTANLQKRVTNFPNALPNKLQKRTVKFVETHGRASLQIIGGCLIVVCLIVRMFNLSLFGLVDYICINPWLNVETHGRASLQINRVWQQSTVCANKSTVRGNNQPCMPTINRACQQSTVYTHD